jgi:hypothetical protein
MTFESVSNFVRKHGKNYPDPGVESGCWRYKFLFLEIFYEISWMIDRNVEHISIHLFGEGVRTFTIEHGAIPQ